jgi:hypothetical protein
LIRYPNPSLRANSTRNRAARHRAGLADDADKAFEQSQSLLDRWQKERVNSQAGILMKVQQSCDKNGSFELVEFFFAVRDT